MKKLLLPLMMSAAMAPTIANAQNQTPWYGGLGYTFATADIGVNGFPDLDVGTLGLTVGYRLMDNLAIEGVLGTGVSDDEKTLGGIDIQTKAKEYYGIYFRPYVMVSDQVELYGRLGWFRGKYQISSAALAVTEADSEDDFSYGVGAAFYVAKNTALTLDYTQFLDKDGTDISGYTLGVRVDF